MTNIYGLETVVSVLFSHTRTHLLYNEREIFNTVLKISSSLYSKQVRVFENKTQTVSNPFNIQSEFTAGDRLRIASSLTCLNEKTME